MRPWETPCEGKKEETLTTMRAIHADRHRPRSAPPGNGADTAEETGASSDDDPPLSADPASWIDWRWQLANRIRTVDQLRSFFPNIGGDQGIEQASAQFPMAVTPYYASLIREADSRDPIFRMAVPQFEELLDPPFLRDDPLEEDEDMPVPGLVHRYPDRALFVATSVCAVYCRHCTRKRVAGAQEETPVSPRRLNAVVRYLSDHPEIRDVIVSGGDPFTMSTAALDRVLGAIRSVPSVEVIRIGTRAPVTLPMRVTGEFVDMLRRHHPLYVNTHFNHPTELTPAASAACRLLADAGIPLGNQTVLLRGVNDDPRLLEELFRGLLRMRVRPYYLFQCDLVRGVEHFRTPISRGIEIMEYLRGRLSGLAIPLFVVDTPHGGGKIPLLPGYIISQSPTHTVLRNFEGMMISYPEPLAAGAVAVVGADGPTSGVWELATGRETSIRPERSARLARRRAGHEAR